jgi:signal transduction histidine kinase
MAVIDPAMADLDLLEPRATIAEVRANGSVVFCEGGITDEAPGPSAPGGPPSPFIRFRPGNARVLEFRFASILFEEPGEVRFRYRLLGLHDHWMEPTSRREVTFTDLRPGVYRLELVACGHHGVWMEQPVALGFEVTPFYYQTWWFYLGAGGLAGGLVLLAAGWRIRELRRIQHLERLNALNEQRRQIARDIHDELGASLTHIVQISAQTARVATQPGLVVQQARRIADLAGEAVDNIGEIVWANNHEYDTLEDLVAYLREYAANFFSETPFRVNFDFPETVPAHAVSGMFRRHLVLLVKECLQNISRHSAARTVTIRLALPPGRLELAIADDGRGFTREKGARTGNGLTHMRLRTEELRGTFAIHSTLGQGTEVRVSVPFTEA